MINLPNKKLIEEIINKYYSDTYGNNFDESSLNSSIQCAEVIIKWLFENS